MQEAFYSVVEGCRGAESLVGLRRDSGSSRWASARVHNPSLGFGEAQGSLAGIRRGTLKPRGASATVREILRREDEDGGGVGEKREKRGRWLGLRFVLL